LFKQLENLNPRNDMPTPQKDIDELVKLLAEKGYPDALSLFVEDLVPLAKRQHLSLFEAMSRYMDGGLDDEEDDFHRFRQAYWKISRRKLSKLNIHQTF